MLRLRSWSIASALLMFVAIALRADEEVVPLDRVPQAVLDAVKARFPAAKLVGAEKEEDDGKTVYEIGIKSKGQSIDVTLSEEGTILEIEKAIAAKDLPDAVSKTLETKYPKASYKIIEEITKVTDGKEKLEYYEVLLATSDSKKLEVSVAPDGKVLKEEDKNGAADDE